MTAPLHAGPTASTRLRTRTARDRFLANGSVGSIALFFLAVVILFSATTDSFLSLDNVLNILRQSAPLLIVATAMTLVITTGGIDLSVGSILALTGALTAILIHAGVPWLATVVLMLACGGLVGALQGFFIAYEGIPAFIVTLAGLSVIRGTALLVTGGYSIPIPSDIGVVALGRAWVFGRPLPALIAAVILVLGVVIFN